MRMGLVGVVGAVAVGTAGVAHGGTFDPHTGLGFVGKGQVQSAFGWNDAEFQRRARHLEFRVDADVDVAWSCTWDTGATEHFVTGSHSWWASVPYAPRTNPQGRVTGIELQRIVFVHGSTSPHRPPWAYPEACWVLDPVPHESERFTYSGDAVETATWRLTVSDGKRTVSLASGASSR